jgi:uncharacterized membrane protein HdeD (DUF308 family)
LALRGTFAILFGILAIVWPGATILSLVLLFGIYALAEGILSGVMAFAKQPPQPRWLLGLEAVLGVFLGFAAITRPGITAVTMLVVMGVWAVAIGGVRIVQAIALRKQLDHEWLLAASGVLAIGVGILVLAQPAAGALAVAWLIGVLAIALGVSEISLAMRLRNLPSAREAGMRLWAMRTEEHPEVARDRVKH